MSSITALPWDQEPFYLEAIRRVKRADDPTAYVDSPKPDTANGDITTFIVGQARWSVDNLPEILYLIDPPPSRTTFQKLPKPTQKRNSQGKKVWEQWPMKSEQPRPILDYAVLPDQISSNVQWWRLEAWHRLEPRMKWEDIIMRMRPRNGVRERSVQVDTRTLNVRVFVKREAFAILSWGGKQGKAQDGIRAKLNARVAPSNPNSSRGITPGLIDPNGPDTAANRVPLPKKTIEDQTQEDPVTAAAPAQQDADSDDDGQLPKRTIEDQTREDPVTAAATAQQDADSDDDSQLPNKGIEDQTQEDQVINAATAHQDAASDDHDAESDNEVRSRPRSELDIAVDRLLITAAKGPRVLEHGASDNFEDYSSNSSSEDEAID